MSNACRACGLSQFEDEILSRTEHDGGTAGGNDGYISLTTLDRWINQSIANLWDIILANGGQSFLPLTKGTITTVSGTETYNLPNSCYKLLSAFANFGTTQKQRMRQIYAQEYTAYTNLTWAGTYGGTMAYMVDGVNMWIVPTPASAITIDIIYVTAPTTLTAETSIDMYMDWEEYVVADVCTKIAIKESEDPSGHIYLREAALDRIRTACQERDRATAHHIVDVEELVQGDLAFLFSPSDSG